MSGLRIPAVCIAAGLTMFPPERIVCLGRSDVSAGLPTVFAMRAVLW